MVYTPLDFSKETIVLSFNTPDFTFSPKTFVREKTPLTTPSIVTISVVGLGYILTESIFSSTEAQDTTVISYGVKGDSQANGFTSQL